MKDSFLTSIKPGQYVKTGRRDGRSVRKVSKVTKTQIVISKPDWGDELRHERFRISDGRRIGDSPYYRHYIFEDPVSLEEIAAYEARIADQEKMRKESKRVGQIEKWAEEKLTLMLGIPAEQITVQFYSRDGMKTGLFDIKCEKISESALISALERLTP
jgi:hypothetical protein